MPYKLKDRVRYIGNEINTEDTYSDRATVINIHPFMHDLYQVAFDIPVRDYHYGITSTRHWVYEDELIPEETEF